MFSSHDKKSCSEIKNIFMLVHPYLHGNYINILERNPKPNPNQEPGKLENLVYHKLQKNFLSRVFKACRYPLDYGKAVDQFCTRKPFRAVRIQLLM